MKNNLIKIKRPDVDPEEFLGLDWKLYIVIGYFKLFCEKNKLECCLNSIKEFISGRISKSHEEGRAFDASTKQMTQEQIDNCISFMNEKVGFLGAYSKSDKKQRVVIYHNSGNGYHLHFQVHP
jgi:hypothetical protein